MKTVYAIPNCNTVKKALDWLKANKVAYEFHDYKKNGITATKLNPIKSVPKRIEKKKQPISSAVMLLVLNGFLLMYAFSVESIYAVFMQGEGWIYIGTISTK
jgi:hypothetical protein